MVKNDSLGDRMKGYEGQYASQKLLPRIPIIARIDGRAFHTFCKGLERPYDKRLSDLMVRTTEFLVKETAANCGYTQSDEISLVWYDPSPNSEVFFKERLLKMASVSASMATAFFNKHLQESIPEKANIFAFFDSRVFNVPSETEAANYFVWREMDATRNSVSMAAQSYFTHKELQGKKSAEMQEMLFQKEGINWNDYPTFFKRGTYVQKQVFKKPFTTEEIESLPEKHAARTNPNLEVERQNIVVLDLPPLKKVINKADVLLFQKQPRVQSDLEVEGSEEVDDLLQELDSLRSKFTQITSLDDQRMDNIIAELVERKVYFETPMIRKFSNDKPYRKMVECWGVYWFRYSAPFECPLCEANLCDEVHGPPFKREIGMYSMELDRTTRMICPDCEGTILVR